MNKIEAKVLIDKYKSGTLSEEEKYLLENWYAKLAQSNELTVEEGELNKNLYNIWENINRDIVIPNKKNVQSIALWKKLTVAAAVIVVTTVALNFYKDKLATGKAIRLNEQLAESIKPGRNRATLTLANGKVITLDDATNGKLAEQNGVTVTKTKDGQLVYSLSTQQTDVANNKPAYNTINTPKGGQYQINLPDGSKVWLNAQSSLQYPTFFIGNERTVTLTGEAYFEIAKSKVVKGKKAADMPFVVRTAQQKVEVLGTHFNINSYTDELSAKTTLLEGAIKVSSLKTPEAEPILLKPNEQLSLVGNKISVNAVNTDEAIAWKNGFFMFKDADLKMVMRSLSRWYDVDVVYEGIMPHKEFSGEIHRNLNLKQVFEILSFYKVKFRIEGKRIIVRP